MRISQLFGTVSLSYFSFLVLVPGCNLICDASLLAYSSSTGTLYDIDLTTGAAVASVTIPGNGGLNLSDMEFSPVPIPASIWLFCTGMLGLISVARRKVRA